ncbi:MAG: efflux RND transporter permease subunit, partial [Flavobacteriales bacterium]|nr:efflux RND transporter permease subunit [Flavobacteriales bacterium]
MRPVIAHFIKYPVAVNVTILAFFFLGLIGMFSMRSSFFPLSDSKIVTVQVVYPGASPQEMEEGVVLKIEDNIRGLVGVDRFTSTSRENAANITVEAEKGYPIDILLADVKNAVDKVPSFPTEMEPPVVAKQENLNTAIVFAVSGEDVSLRTLKSLGRQIESDLRSIDGISQVSLTGFPAEEITISLNEEKMRSWNITFREVSNAISSNNILVTGGSVKTEAEEYLIRVNERSYHANKLDNLILKTSSSGSIVRLKDVADVEDVWSETPERSFFNGKSSVEIKVQTTNNEDLVVASDLVKEYIQRYNENNETVKLNVTRDPSLVIVQ